MSTGALAVTGLAHRYGELPVLDSVDLTAAPGEVIALVGPTGCGKSTVLRVLAGLLVPTRGTAHLDGADLVGRPGRAAFMPQTDALLPWRRALDNAIVGAELRGTPRPQARERARELFRRFGLAGFERAWPGELSGGMRQRVALLRTVLAGSTLLLLDEPFGALDAITRADLHGWLSELLVAEPRTTLLVTHDVDEALRLTDRVVVMSPRPGRVVATHPTPGTRPRPLMALTDPATTETKRSILASLGAG